MIKVKYSALIELECEVSECKRVINQIGGLIKED